MAESNCGPRSATMWSRSRRMLPSCARRWPWRIVEVDETVADTWRVHAQPTSDRRRSGDLPGVGGCRFRPRRHRPAHRTGCRRSGSVTTRRRCCRMRALRAALHDGATVLDVGCGSGVLAVGACVLGASHATAIDISPASVPTTRANASANGVADRIDVSTTPLAEVDGAFDVVVANILAPTLIDLADDLRRVVAPSGC